MSVGVDETEYHQAPCSVDDTRSAVGRGDLRAGAERKNRVAAKRQRAARMVRRSSMVTTMPPSTRMSVAAQSEPELSRSLIEISMKQQRYFVSSTSQYVESRRQHSYSYLNASMGSRLAAFCAG